MAEVERGLEDLVRRLKEDGVIAEIVRPIKSGKESVVHRCLGHPSTGEGDLALKVFRELEHRSFRNDAIYREGSQALRKGGGDTREARALRKGSRFGRRFAAKTWVEHEWWVLNRLWEHGLPVPRPVRLVDGAILMELVATPDGEPAPPLHTVDLSLGTAKDLSRSLARDVEEMLSLDLVHGDLSPYNVLWDGADYRIIDFPQAVDARFNPNAWELLLRDLTVLGDFFAGFGAEGEASALAHRLWTRYRGS